MYWVRLSKNVFTVQQCKIQRGEPDGNGASGTKALGSTDSAEECIELVKKDKPKANAMLWKADTSECYPIYHATGLNYDEELEYFCIFDGTYCQNSNCCII